MRQVYNYQLKKTEPKVENPKVYCISGKACHGKNYVGDAIKQAYEEHGGRVLMLANADYLKFLAHLAGDYNYTKETTGVQDPKDREGAQRFGTDFVRNYNDGQFEDYWVDEVIRQINLLRLYGNYDAYIITDCRFPNEIKMLKEAGSWRNFSAVSIRVRRFYVDKDGNKTDYVSPLSEQAKRHPSETALDNYPYFDFQITNVEYDPEYVRPKKEYVKKIDDGLDSEIDDDEMKTIVTSLLYTYDTEFIQRQNQKRREIAENLFD